MKKILIIGGGLSGITAAVYLSRAGNRVTLFEASPSLGGRIASFLDSDTGTVLDRGQHIMMGCYEETIELLDIIGTRRFINPDAGLSFRYVEKGGKQSSLRIAPGFYPFNAITGLLRFSALNLSDRISILFLIISFVILDEKKLKSVSSEEWLRMKGQSKRAIAGFWEMTAISVFNANLKDINASDFLLVMKKIFIGGNRGISVIIPDRTLEALFIEPSGIYIEGKDSEIILSERVTELRIENNRITSVITSASEYKDFDYVVSAIPPSALEKIYCGKEINREDKFSYESILNVHLWLDHNNITAPVYGLISSELHWVFNKGNYISITRSAANGIIELSREELLGIVFAELEKYFPWFTRKTVIASKIIKEKRATCNNREELGKLKSSFKQENLLICGDWTDDEYPCTIESAVRSGKDVAFKINAAN